ncbi:tripartite motif-containing protein 65 [Scaptodrosophila lebanonensis]|uniref:Tripartite motif-containing protein 65 n=1 Tax=Drosophila lebanonensis TaxID=7225 RepID=A0A6J2TES1_DROLE|nr:tripartite motif-containing protein 65 [Scaptodrosophila lebanonensis]
MDRPHDMCAVCLNRKRNKVSIQCKHSFCKRCLQKVYDISPSKSCPLCRAPFEYYIRERGSGTKIVFFS